MVAAYYAPLRKGDAVISVIGELWTAEHDDNAWHLGPSRLGTQCGWPLILRSQVLPMDFDFLQDI